ncbi:ankyrin repeat domain-containing protein [Paraburkholderia dilworthii]|uniref:Ankyrin repeat domain-containing protein n=1 Tax=Paraburkholderia dilworthii TaxID=948106 RepID=A0ABW9D773_9BURK
MLNTNLTAAALFKALNHGGELPHRQAMLDAGIDVNDQDAAGSTLLHHAVLRGLACFALELVDAGADVNAQDKDGCAALHHAARLGNRFLVVELVDAGADVKAIDSDGRTALHRAALGCARDEYEDFAAIARHLVRSGAEQYAQDARHVMPCDLLRTEVEHLPNAAVIRRRFPF